MKKVLITTLVLFTFAWISGVYAGKALCNSSPESLVTCSSLDIDDIYTYVVTYTAISGDINGDMCIWESLCNPCVESLEKQGCTVVDLQIDHNLRDIGTEAPDWPQTFATYALSCKKP